MGKKGKRLKSFINTSVASTMLKQIHLGGVINECVIEIVKGKASVEAIDITNNLVYISTAKIGSKRVSNTIGIGNIELLAKFLSTMTESKLSVDFTENRMLLTRKDKRRRLEYLLSQPALIATKLRMDDDDQDEDMAEKFLNMIEIRADLSESFIKDFNSYISTLKTKIVTIEIDGDDAVFALGPKSEHQFKLSLELNESSDEFTLRVNGDYLSKIFSVIEFGDENAEPVTIGFGEEKPIVIEMEESIWAIVPSEEMEED